MKQKILKKGGQLFEEISNTEKLVRNCEILIKKISGDHPEIKNVSWNGLLISENTDLFQEYLKNQLVENQKKVDSLNTEFENLK